MDHVWGQPFPRFPIDGFQNLTICTAGFVNEQLNQIEKTVIQLGATYSERLNRQVSLLICEGLASLREQKRDLAIYHNITIVDVEWLWQCITTGCLVPACTHEAIRYEMWPPSAGTPLSAGVDVTAFDSDMPGANRETPCLPKQERYESHYEVAPTHPRTRDNTPTAVPLSEITGKCLEQAGLATGTASA
ncbi:hypothetical protein NUW58_g10911 [Xylaria curta]|uniref:Uncharacterized protein n=1 Tax=Xylaria curta TaxID=42375 RepID=A0ACC1MEN1_9PEZI|nr:hypothetical protein NUW58_g10911 [Xylaria curta]